MSSAWRSTFHSFDAIHVMEEKTVSVLVVKDTVFSISSLEHSSTYSFKSERKTEGRKEAREGGRERRRKGGRKDERKKKEKERKSLMHITVSLAL